jgi:hypothetical protein
MEMMRLLILTGGYKLCGLLKKLIRFLFRVLDFAGKYGMIALMAYVLANAAKLEYDYMKKYEGKHAEEVREVAREHDRQILVSQMIDSQSCWERQGEVLQSAYLEEKARRNAAEQNLKQNALETYYILRQLEREHPEVYKEVMEDHKIPPDVWYLFREFDQSFFYGDEIDPGYYKLPGDTPDWKLECRPCMDCNTDD